MITVACVSRQSFRLDGVLYTASRSLHAIKTHFSPVQLPQSYSARRTSVKLELRVGEASSTASETLNDFYRVADDAVRVLRFVCVF